MPAASTDALASVAAALENNFKVSKKYDLHKNLLVTCNGSKHEEDDVTTSWVDQIIGNEVCLKECIEYTEQKGKAFVQRWKIEDLKRLKMDVSSRILSNGIVADNAMQVKSSSTVSKKEDQLQEPRFVLYPKEKVKLGWATPPARRAGMVNMGNTCYLNSSLQALFHIPPFANWLSEESQTHLGKCSQDGLNASFCSLCAMIKTLRASVDTNASVIRPFQIATKIKCIGKQLSYGTQEDAHEFIKLLLDNMERSYLRFRGASKLDHLSRQTTPLNQIFGGFLRQQVCCPSCHYVSTTFSPFQDLVLDIRSSNSLEQALENYFRQETLDAANCYKCERCKKKVPATKRCLIERPPNVLLIQLKRFTMNGNKIGKHIHIEKHLNMSRFVNGFQKHNVKASGMNGAVRPKGAEDSYPTYSYKLVSMVVHLGSSQSCGHYIAFAEGAHGSMYEFNDSSVRDVSLNTVLQSNPYILFYELTHRSPESVVAVDVAKQQTASPQLVTKSVSVEKKQMNGHVSVANGFAVNDGEKDLGEIISRETNQTSCSLVPASQWERVCFGLKQSSPSIIKKTIVHNSFTPLLASSLSKASPSNVSPSVSKLVSVGQLLSQRRADQNKATEQSSSSGSKLVPYDADSDASDDDKSSRNENDVASSSSSPTVTVSNISHSLISKHKIIGAATSSGTSLGISKIKFDGAFFKARNGEVQLVKSTAADAVSSSCERGAVRRESHATHKSGTGSTTFSLQQNSAVTKPVKYFLSQLTNGCMHIPETESVASKVHFKRPLKCLQGSSSVKLGGRAGESSSSSDFSKISETVSMGLLNGEVQSKETTREGDESTLRLSTDASEALSRTKESRPNGHLNSHCTKSDTSHAQSFDVNSSCTINAHKKRVNSDTNSRLLNGDSKQSDNSDGSDEEGPRYIVKSAAATQTVAWDKHTRGDLAYTLSSHKKETFGDPENRKRPLWTASEDSAQTTRQLQSSTNFAFGTKVTTWDDEESYLDRLTRSEVQEASRRSELELHEEVLEAGKKKRKKFSDHEESQVKKQCFDSYIRLGSDAYMEQRYHSYHQRGGGRFKRHRSWHDDQRNKSFKRRDFNASYIPRHNGGGYRGGFNRSWYGSHRGSFGKGHRHGFGGKQKYFKTNRSFSEYNRE